MKKYISNIIFFLALSSHLLHGQNLTFSWDGDFTVCQKNTLIVNVENNTNSTHTNPSIFTTLPCGFNAVPNSLSGNVQLSSQSSDRLPIFTLPEMKAGEKLTFTFKVQLSCEALQCLDQKETFFINSKYKNGTLEKEFKTDKINVLSPEIIIQNIEDVFVEIPSYSSRDRKIYISNSRLGKATYFEFQITHDEGIYISTDLGKILQQSPTQLLLAFDSTVFVTIGNKDKYFDFNETIILTETEYADLCSYEVSSTRTDYAVFFKCGEESCHTANAIANNRIIANEDKGPKLSFSYTTEEPLCYFAGTAQHTVSVLKAAHKVPLENIRIEISAGYDYRGILISSVQSDLPGTIQYVDTLTNDCGQLTAQKVVFFISKIDAQSVSKLYMIHFQMAFCEESNCETKKNYWLFNYSYEKYCSEQADTHFKGRFEIGEREIFATRTQLFFFDENGVLIPLNLGLITLKDGQMGYISVIISDSRLQDNKDGTIDIELKVPLGIVLQNLDFIFGDHTPIHVSTSSEDDNTVYVLTYKLPFNQTTNDMLIPFIFDCDLVVPDEECPYSYASCYCNPPKIYKTIKVYASLKNDENCDEDFIPVGCYKISYFIDCENVKPCYRDTLAGNLEYTMTLERTSFGWYDSDDDGVRDIDSIPIIEKYKLQHFVPGDTFKIMMKGAIITDIPGSTFATLAFKEGFKLFSGDSPNTIQVYRDILFGIDGALKTISAKLKIKQKSTGKIFEFAHINPTRDSLSFIYNFSTDTLIHNNVGTSLPSSFRYAVGDSVFMEFEKYFDFEKFKESKNLLELEQLFEMTYFFDQYLGDEHAKLDFNRSPCDCFPFNIVFAPFQMTKVGQSINVQVANTKLCTDDFYKIQIYNLSFGHVYDLGPVIGRVFPHEIRPSLWPKSVKLTTDPNLDFGKLTVSYLGNTFDILPKVVGDYTVYDIDSTQISPAGTYMPTHNNYICKVSLEVKPKVCLNQIPKTSSEVTIAFRLNELGKLYFPDSITSTLNTTFLKPDIQLQLFQNDVTAFSDNFSTNFSINGLSNIKEVAYPFIRIEVPSGNIKDLVITDTVSGKEYTSINQIYQLDVIKRNETKYFELSGISTGCLREQIILHYGFDCEPYSNLSTKPCLIKTDTLNVFFPDGLVDIIVDSLAIKDFKLCDTTEQKVTIYNAGLGNAKNILFQISLPPGISFIENSAIIYHPSGQNTNGIVLPKPQINPTNGSLFWNLSDFWSAHASNGLEGANFIPYNTFDLVFKFVSNCDLISGLPIDFFIKAENGCGQIVNQLHRFSQPVKIDDLAPPSDLNIQAEANFLDPCEKEKLHVKITFDNPNSDAVKMAVDLSESWKIDVPSIETTLTKKLPVVKDGLWQWETNSTQSIAVLEFDIINESNYFCTQDIIYFYLFSPAIAQCENLGQDCEILSVITSTSLSIKVQQPSYNWFSNNLSFTDEQLHLESLLLQEGSKIQDTVKCYIVNDNNHNGTYDIGDTLIDSIYYGGFLQHDTSMVIQDFVRTNFMETCNLLLVIDGHNCVCQNIEAPLERDLFTEENISVCSGESISIGSASTDIVSSYWNDGEGLECSTCALTTFKVYNSTTQVTQYTKILKAESSDGCFTTHTYHINVSPQPRILVDKIHLCYGDTLRALASVAISYSWVGPNIITNATQELVALPTTDTSYYCIIKDGYGCENQSQLIVDVIEKPEYTVLSQQSFCKGDLAQINVNASNFDNFIWLTGADRLDNAQSLTPIITRYEDFNFRLELQKGMCQVVVDIPISFVDTLQKVSHAVICKGDFYTFEGKDYSDSGWYCTNYPSTSGCDSMVCLQLYVIEYQPFESDTLYKFPNETIVISAPSGFEIYSWSPFIDLKCEDCQQNSTITQEPITYVVTMTDASQCVVEKRFYIKIKTVCQPEDVLIPNAFSPNNDQINDVFTLGDIDLCGPMHLKIFNRWGNLVYEEADWDNHWEGISNNGNFLPQGTYFYKITFTDSGTTRSGMVDLRIK